MRFVMDTSRIYNCKRIPNKIVMYIYCHHLDKIIITALNKSRIMLFVEDEYDNGTMHTCR